MKRICPNCLIGELHWDQDHDAEDYGYCEPGIVIFYHCEECGAEIEVFVPQVNEYKGELR